MSSNLFGKFKIYPRGFLGAQLEPVLVSTSSPSAQRLQYDVSMFNANEPEWITANLEIEEAYKSLLRRDNSARDFDFREKTLRSILKAFGTLDFEGWYMAQYQSPSFGEQQRDFLDDCFQFIWTGKRSLSLENWDVLLQASENKVTDPHLSKNAALHFNRKFVRELNPTNRMPLTVTVQDWLRQPNGFTDLLLTCHILFGIKR